MEKEIMNVKETRQGRVGQVFKMKGNISGQKKAGTEPHAIKDPITDELLVENKVCSGEVFGLAASVYQQREMYRQREINL